jgi:type II secretory pathway predicted ATPase ExeA
VCRFNARCAELNHIKRAARANLPASGYNLSAVDDPEIKRALADDAGFLDQLNDLDRGLHADAPLAKPQPSAAPVVNTPTPPAPAQLARRATPPPTFIDQPRHRPLLDLFPPTPLAVGRPPDSTSGTAVGPQLPEVPRQPAPAPSPPGASPAVAAAETFYGLHDKPFGISTDPKFLFASGAHERATTDLLAAIRDRDGVMLLTGEPGAGTTTVCRALVRRLDRHTFSSLVLQPVESVERLLRTMLVDFGLVERDTIPPAPALPREVLVATLRAFIDSLAALHASAVVIVDHAQQQPAAMLESLGDLIGSGEAASGLLVVLAGPPQLTARLADRPKLRALDAAIRSRVELGPLAREEMAGYVEHRLSAAGPTDRVRFDEGALQRIFELSGGVPGTVNTLCDRALTVAASRSAPTIDASMVAAAAPDTHAQVPPAAVRSRALILVGAALLVALTFAGASAALWIFRGDAARTLELWEDVPAAPAAPVPRRPAPLRAIPPPADALADQPGVNPRVSVLS